MKASTMVLAMAMCAMLAVAYAADEKPKAKEQHHSHEPEYYEGGDSYGHEKKYKAFSLYAGPFTTCNGNATTCGSDIGGTRTLYADAAFTLPVATLYQAGVVVKTGLGATLANQLADTRAIYWQSFRFTGLNGFGEGTIQTQGDDTGFDDPTFTNRAITGGTGIFTGVAGYLTRGGNPATTTPGPYTFVLTQWNKDYDYGYDSNKGYGGEGYGGYDNKGY